MSTFVTICLFLIGIVFILLIIQESRSTLRCNNGGSIAINPRARYEGAIRGFGL